MIRGARCLVVFRAAAYFRELSTGRAAGVFPTVLAPFRRLGISALFGIVIIHAGGAVDRHPDLLLPPPSQYISPAALGGGRLSRPILFGMTSRLRARTVTANRLQFGVLEAGSGPLALCLHGFPDSARTWRYLLPALADAGFHAVAPFMRGYAPTEIPEDGCFGLGALVADAVGLHDVLGGDGRAVLIGSDWGAEVAYGAAAFAPDRWRRVVTLGVPPLALDTRIFADYDQLKRFFYLFFLKTPLAESVLAAGDMAFLGRLWQDWSPGYDASEDLRNVKQCLRGEGNLAAAIGYYRADEPGLRRFAADGAYAAQERALASGGPQPTLYLHGNRDGCISLSLVQDAGRHLASGSRMEVVEGAGHFLQVEKPAAVNDRVLAWVSA